MACSWLRRLNEQYPDLALRARELNRRDGFVMWEDDPVAKQKWLRKKAEKERKKREKMMKRQSQSSRKKADDDSSSSEKSMDLDNSESKRLARKEKWGEHRTAERKKDDMQLDCENDAFGARVVSPH